MEYLQFITVKAMGTSMGFITLLIGEVLINGLFVLYIISLRDYAIVQFWFFVGLLIVFVPSMILREHLKNQNDEKKHQAIVDHIEGTLTSRIDESEARIIDAILKVKK